MDKLNLSPYDRMTAWVIEIDERLGTDFGKYLLGLGELWNSFKNNDNHDYKTALAFAVPVAAIITSAVPAYAQTIEQYKLPPKEVIEQKIKDLSPYAQKVMKELFGDELQYLPGEPAGYVGCLHEEDYKNVKKQTKKILGRIDKEGNNNGITEDEEIEANWKEYKSALNEIIEKLYKHKSLREILRNHIAMDILYNVFKDYKEFRYFFEKTIK